jgi:protein-S-isoprenylcysteine O-methyltransferase Ste14
MLPQRLTAVLLSIPMAVLIVISIRYWIEFGKKEQHGSVKQNISYNKFFLIIMAIGYFSIWPIWVCGILFLFLNKYYILFDFLTFSFPMILYLQIAGLAVFYTGSAFFAWALYIAGKSLRPSISGVYTDHTLIQDGPLGIVRHPYYVSYVLILVGLSGILTTLVPLVVAFCVVIGMGSMAKAEEEHLLAMFGKEYEQYRKRVGKFFPKLFR